MRGPTKKTDGQYLEILQKNINKNCKKLKDLEAKVTPTKEKTKVRNTIAANKDRMKKRKDLIWIKELLLSEIPLKIKKTLSKKIHARITNQIEVAGINKDQRKKYEKKQSFLISQSQYNLTQMLDCILELGGDGAQEQDDYVENEACESEEQMDDE